MITKWDAAKMRTSALMREAAKSIETWTGRGEDLHVVAELRARADKLERAMQSEDGICLGVDTCDHADCEILRQIGELSKVTP